MEPPKISVIIPIFNEERTIGSIIEVARTWRPDAEVIVVNDGSRDKTFSAIKHFNTNVEIISYKKNRGKGFAMATGIEASRGEILMFLDGDLVGLTHHDLDLLVEPVERREVEMTMGSVRLWTLQKKHSKFFDALSGERALRKKMIMSIVEEMKTVGYGVELLMNNLYKDKKTMRVKLPHVYLVGKLDKQTMPLAVRSYAIETRELITQAVKQHANDLSPQAKKIFQGIQGYLKTMLESL